MFEFLRSIRKPTKTREPRQARPCLESLERREVPATLSLAVAMAWRIRSMRSFPRAVLKATVKATPVDADRQGSTDHLVGLVPGIQCNALCTSVDALDCNLLGLQNRWSASLAMSTDGSLPSRPRHFLNTNLPARQ